MTEGTDEHGRDVELAREKDEADEDDVDEEVEQERAEAEREQQEEEAERKLDEEDEEREGHAQETANPDAHRDERPYTS